MLQQTQRLGAPLVVVLLAALYPSMASAETRTVRRGQNLQSALNSAVPGDVILLEAGAEYVGSFTLPAKVGDAPIVVQSAAVDQLPEEGVRISPAYAGQLARIRSGTANPAIKTAPG